MAASNYDCFSHMTEVAFLEQRKKYLDNVSVLMTCGGVYPKYPGCIGSVLQRPSDYAGLLAIHLFIWTIQDLRRLSQVKDSH